MPVGEHVVARVREHVAAGSLSAAHELLAAALAAVPADPAQAAPATAVAVGLQTGVLLGLGEPYAARGWAAYGYAACRALHGERDRRTLHALGLLAAVLARVGVHARAVTRYLDLIAAYTELDGPDSDRVLAARGDLATVEHAQGHCVTARLRLATVIDEHRRRHGTAHPVGVRMQLRLAAMWRDCGGFNDAHELLTDARADAAGLDPDDPVHALVSAAAYAAADPRHQCGVGLIPDTPISPVGLTRPDPAAGEAPPAPPAPKGPHPAVAPWDHLTPHYEAPSVLAAPMFTATVYLPPYVSEPEQARPAAPRRAEAVGPARRLPQHTLVLVAACVGIVAIALLFVLMVSSVSR
jgi:hypothetical protein